MLEAIVYGSLVWLFSGAAVSGLLLNAELPEPEWLGYLAYGPISWLIGAAIWFADRVAAWVHD